jgi:enoyl-CoA hydratase/carnithine racemase
MSNLILCERRGVAAVLTLNAPEQRNAISSEMRVDLLDQLESVVSDETVRAIVITGAAEHFCSGGQLQTAANGFQPDVERTRRNMSVLHGIVQILSAGPKPSIAAVQGYAYGAGLSLASACDLVVAAEGARFCASFGKVGLMPDAGLMWTLAQRVGHARAREILLTGRVVDATEAAAIALADRLVPVGMALEAALKIAEDFVGMAPLAIASIKHAMSYAGSLKEVLEFECESQPRLTLSADYVEGRVAFKERRHPVFRGN